MIRAVAICAALAALSACGVDGPPAAPSAKGAKPGLHISGEASFGIATIGAQK